MISILIPTNRINKNVFSKIKTIQESLQNHKFKELVFTDEFNDLITDRITGINHYLEMTLRSLEGQTYKDFEVIISHRYPEDALDIVSKYDIDIKLIKEKPSLWHEIGPKYPTLSNNINTAFIHSSGDLLWRLDDLTFFNNDTLKEIADVWYNNHSYITSRAIRCIEFDDNILDKKPISSNIGVNKVLYEGYGWRGQFKKLTAHEGHVQIPNNMCWGFSSTISRDDFLKVNGHDELWDGAIRGTDMELGARVDKITNNNRYTSNGFVYEIDDIPYKYSTREDQVFRKMIYTKHIVANSWKPSITEFKRYERWHKKNVGDLDENWKTMLDIPYFDLKEEYELKRLGEIIYAR